MILLTARIIRILLLLTALAGNFLLFRRKTDKKRLICLEIWIVIFAFAANAAAAALPPLTDEVTLTALGKKQQAAQAEEVYLAGYTVDDKISLAGEDLEIIGGKWFWSGETYAWRIETDTRQPEGTTRSITVRIPAGWARTLDFSGNRWRGMVEISVGGNTWVADTFSEESTTISVPIGRSQTSTLIWNQVRGLFVYLIVLFGLFAITAMATLWVLHHKEQTLTWVNRHWEVLSYIGIALCALVFMCVIGNTPFWYDEMCQIGYLQDDLLHAITVDPCTPPLFSAIAFFWYKIAPYGEQYLLFICKVITALGVFLLGITGRRFFNYLTGLFAMLLGAFNYTLTLQCGQEFRAYCTAFLLSVIVLYLFLQHIEEGLNPQRRNMLAYAVAIALSAYNHYFGVFICVPIFLYDCILFIRKKVRLSFVMPYLLGGVLYLPWLIFMLTPRNIGIQLTWQPVPDLNSLQQIVSGYLCGGIAWEQYLFFFSVIWIVTKYIRGAQRIDHDATGEFHLPVVFIAAFFPLMIFVYGKYIHYKSTFWVNRYFTCLLPYVLLICGMGLTFLIDEARKNKEVTTKLSISLLLLSGIIFQSMAVSINSGKNYQSRRMKDAADWLYSQSNYIFNDNTVILVAFSDPEIKDGWKDYYVERQGRRDELNVARVWDLSEDEILMYDRIYLVYVHTGKRRTEFFDQHYTIESDWTNIDVAVYVK